MIQEDCLHIYDLVDQIMPITFVFSLVGLWYSVFPTAQKEFFLSPEGPHCDFLWGHRFHVHPNMFQEFWVSLALLRPMCQRSIPYNLRQLIGTLYCLDSPVQNLVNLKINCREITLYLSYVTSQLKRGLCPFLVFESATGIIFAFYFIGEILIWSWQETIVTEVETWNLVGCISL